MRFLVYAISILILAGCAITPTPTSRAGAPKAVVKKLLPYPWPAGGAPYFTTSDELSTIKNYVTPELYGKLWDWAKWAQKAIAAIPSSDSLRITFERMLSDNIFVDAGAVDQNAPITEVIHGDSASVTVTDVLRDKDGSDVVSTTIATFSLVRRGGRWIVREVQVDSTNYQPPSRFQYTLSDRLQRDIINFKEKAK